MVFARDLEHGGESLGVGINGVSDTLRDLLRVVSWAALEGGRHWANGQDVRARRKGKKQGTYMLVDQQDANVLPLTREVVECLLDCGGFGLGVDDEEVALRVWRVGYMLDFIDYVSILQSEGIDKVHHASVPGKSCDRRVHTYTDTCQEEPGHRAR